MSQAKIPANEAERLKALEKTELLDSASSEYSYDTITKIVAEACGTPIALVCLVDSTRVWFKSKFGLDDEHKEVPREIGFCPHTINQRDVFEVQDAQKDMRFADSPMVTQVGFRYYAGVPLINNDGYALGTLCIMDKQPHALPEDKKKFLQDMAVAVTALIDNNNTTTEPSKDRLIKFQNSIKSSNSASISNVYPKVFIVDADQSTKTSITKILSPAGFIIEDYSDTDEFLEKYNDQPGCLISDVKSESIDGLALQRKLKQAGMSIPIIFLASKSNVKTITAAMRAGAIDVLEKPFQEDELIFRINEALELDSAQRKKSEQQQEILSRWHNLTAREREILDLLVSKNAELSNKEIAAKLSISSRTVEVHRSSVMAKMQARSRVELVELAKICMLVPKPN